MITSNSSFTCDNIRAYPLHEHGCYWHAHEGCKYASRPRTHSDYWDEKFRRNKERDARVRAELEKTGWTVVEVWECELKPDKLDATRTRLEREVRYAFVEI